MAEIMKIKLNGISKLIFLVVFFAGILIGIGKILQTMDFISIRVSNLENTKIEPRLIKLETNYLNIDKSLIRIEKKIDKWLNSN